MKSITKVLLIFFLFSIILVSANSQQLAFPTAEGYGKYTKGGRGGAVYEVTNLNATGTGSLGAAIAASGPRTVVFRVSGTIEGDFTIRNDYITIAGQTAPGDGICIKGSITNDASDVIIRYIRIRANPTVETDAIWGRYDKNIIVDHVSASWSSDEVMSLYHNDSVTIQWCMITEACAKNGSGHRFGGIWGNPYGTYHHNLIAHNDSRNPRWASGCGYNDYRNNVVYNWGYNSCLGAEAQQEDKPQFNFSTINMIANYYKPGPGTQSDVKGRIAEPSTRNGEADAGKWWLSYNVVEGNSTVTTDNWKGFARNEAYFRLDEPWDAMTINQESPEDAYIMVLAHAGCSKPNRDTIDKRIIKEVRTGTATYGDNGIITYPSDVGGWPTLANSTAPVDSDHDGMPDSWEKNNGLDTLNADDRNIVDTNGYTMLENYLNSLTGYTPVSVLSVSINHTSVTIEKNKTIQLSSKIFPVNATNHSVTWSSGNEDIAIVSELGLVKGLDTGIVVITATTKDGGFIAECTVEVFNIPVTGISINETEITLEINHIKGLVSTIEPTNATNKKVEWSSSNDSIVTVASTGYVTAISAGSAVITATTEDGNYTATCNVIVPGITDIVQTPYETTFYIYPNPFSNEITISFNDINKVNMLEILNTAGQVLEVFYKDDLEAGFIKLNLDIPGNLFFIKINTDENVFVKKIIRK